MTPIRHPALVRRLGLLTLLALAPAGAGAQTAADSQPQPQVETRTAAPIPAPASPGTPVQAIQPGVIVVAAEARRRLPATVSDATVSIEVHGRDIPATASALAQRATTLLNYLRAQGAERLRTESTSFDPETQEVRNQPNRITGYTGRTSVSFRTVPDRLPALLSGSLENGGSGLAQSGSSPREEEVEAAREELAAEATRTALRRAGAIAKAAGTALGPIARIEVDPAAIPRPPVYGNLAMARAVPPPPMATEAGESEVVAQVQVTVRLGAPAP
ncbi:SIMPL domain-containing protein [Roseomonas elaeocarpi]|uniref:SIMPL domain-containing protein n=1 Tax=Roseomonas elaeocarpi TaxID=907779 RepID=A0ABV6JYU4_9PROT